MRLLKLYFLSLVALFLFACSDDDEGPEYMFDREISEYSVLYDCETGDADSSSCFKIRYRYPYRLDDYAGLCLWFDTTIVNDTSKAVSDKQIRLAHDTSNEETYFHEYKKSGRYYDTIDVSKMVAPFIKDGYDSLQVALFSEYTDGGDPGAVQRLFLHFKDNFDPAIVVPDDSVWSNGVLLSWDRPTDQTSFHMIGAGSGKIYGYNVVIYAIDRPNEDIRDLKVSVQSPAGTDYTGGTIYKRNAQIVHTNDSVYVKELERNDKDKNYLRLVVFDGQGYDASNPVKNHFRMIIEGLRTRSNTDNYEYKVGFSSWDIVGNRSGSQGDVQVDPKNWKGIMTTDSIAPLMPSKIFVEEDSLFPGYAKLDSNNRVRIYWNRSVDPITFKHGITIDSELVIPKNCHVHECYEKVSKYIVEYYNKVDKSWKRNAEAEDRFGAHYIKEDDGTFKLDVLDTGSFVGDTIRRVAPGDTIILRILAVDNSGYKSDALLDTVFVSPGKLGYELKCPVGFVAVSTSDTTSFCMERLEHQDADGKFVTNVLHSEAVAACEAISASGFEVSLCRERDWELACLSGGSLSYGVIEEDDTDASDYLFRVCNVSTNDSTIAADIAKRDAGCMNPMGVRDLPGQYQEWVMGRSEDTIAVLKGSSYKIFEGLDRESIAYCTNRAFPFYTRPAYTQDTVYLYREGTQVDTVYAADTTRTLYKILTKSDFKDTLQFYDVVDSKGKVIGTDYSLYSEYQKGGKTWLDSLANGLTYKPSRKEPVFLTGEKRYYREASSFYKSPTIGFRCCAYKK
ncbi:hypothetical protein [Fibrobacter sp. UWB12]|uniref:hypothetical protein n=1 Tax=Fibrobacter sp. UWB12 TaxID=1896203 RepID=UPI00091A6038|nr:hypothetical protein [Fibrobacter sp. UWB12]SHK58158.1 hypothetical protein SAMN05720759_10428 [Fibrobacter sp. UWB12]